VSEFEVAIEKLKTRKSPSVDQIPAELIKVGGRKIRSEINKVILLRKRRKCLRSGRNVPYIYIYIYMYIYIFTH
jgi:hypothetical protein